MSETGIESKKSLQVLLLVDFLPDSRHPDPWLKNKNIFVYRQALKVAERHRLDCPVLVPFLPGFLRYIYKLRGLTIKNPRPRGGQDGGITYHTLRYNHLPRKYTQSKTAALLNFIRNSKEKFDLIHCHTLYDLGVCALELKKQQNIPLVVTAYGTDVNWLFEDFSRSARRASPEIDQATREVLAGADAAIGVSRDLCGKIEQLGVDPAKIHWVPNGVDRELFGPGDKTSERERLGWERDDKIILYVGNILETKGLGELVEGILLLHNRGAAKNLRVKIAGPDGGYKDKMVAKIAKAGIGKIFEFLGRVNHDGIAALMRAADLFCLPSWREGWPNVVTEALACGTPVVATTVGGIGEIITDPEQGLLVPPHKPVALAATLEAALKKDWSVDKITGAAEPYFYDGIAGTIGEIYSQILLNNQT